MLFSMDISSEKITFWRENTCCEEWTEILIFPGFFLFFHDISQNSKFHDIYMTFIMVGTAMVKIFLHTFFSVTQREGSQDLPASG